MMLEDAGLSVRYPEIHEAAFNKDGKSTVHRRFFAINSRRVSIEQNPQMKFMMIFALLDFYVDAAYPDLEGKSYHQKYKHFSASSDFEVILRQLFRVAKVIRNALVHNHSAFSIIDGHVNVNYTHNKTDFSVQMTTEALTDFYTSVVMYLKGDMGKGNYFLGIVRWIYWNFSAGIKDFSDEFGRTLDQPSANIKIKPYVRQLVLHPQHEVSGGLIRIIIPAPQLQAWESMDFYIEHNGEGYLVPLEALDKTISISEHDLVRNWKNEGSFPPVPMP
jgi:hypothetical protein